MGVIILNYLYLLQLTILQSLTQRFFLNQILFHNKNEMQNALDIITT